MVEPCAVNQPPIIVQRIAPDDSAVEIPQRQIDGGHADAMQIDVLADKLPAGTLLGDCQQDAARAAARIKNAAALGGGFQVIRRHRRHDGRDRLWRQVL